MSVVLGENPPIKFPHPYKNNIKLKAVYTKFDKQHYLFILFNLSMMQTTDHLAVFQHRMNIGRRTLYGVSMLSLSG